MTTDTMKNQNLLDENRTLVSKISEINSNLITLKRQMDALGQEDDMLRIIANLPQINEDIRKVGVGGPEYQDRELNQNLSSRNNALTKKVILDVDQLLRKANLQRASFEEIKNKLQGAKDKISRIPTIRPTTGYNTARFGYRWHPFTGKREFHRGIDIANRYGSPIYATAGGVVIFLGTRGNYGKMIILDHGYGYQTKYAHLDKYLVRNGQEIKRGDLIAKMGSTGRSTGPHLHYEVLKNNKQVNPVAHFYANNQFN